MSRFHFFGTLSPSEKDRGLQGIFISIAGTKGGVGKTLTLAHFVKILGEMNKRVAVVSQHHDNELGFLLSNKTSDESPSQISNHFDYIKLPHCDHLLTLKSKYDVILYEVSNDVKSFEQPLFQQSDACILLSTPEPICNFLLKHQYAHLLKNNPHSVHMVFNRLKFSSEYDFLVKNMKGWGLEDHSSISTSYIPEDQALLDDLIRRDVFHTNYLQRVSGQSWRQLLESILRQQNSNQLSRSRAA